MRTNLIKVICLCVVIIMCVSIFCACNNDDDYRNPRNGEPEAGEFYTLQEAYDNGWLSKGDLRNIAYYYAGDGQRKGFKPTPKNPETLSAETELAIKEDWAQKLKSNNDNMLPDWVSEDLENLIIKGYYGTFNGLVAIMKQEIYFTYIKEIYVGGIKFEFPSNVIEIWKYR